MSALGSKADSFACSSACPLLTRSGHSGSAVEAEDSLPVVLHADHDPAVLLGLIEQLLGERADLGIGKAVGWSIGIFAGCIVVQHEHLQAQAIAGGGVFQHLPIPRGVAKRSNRTT